ncbi:hypothetical protein E3O11_12165 [Cryobacterium levicorallinum]|uniref:Uncharacterized protein n=1 Tax=Cryobacterium levicorallinum TaxID=995038 RepID=A0A1I3A5G7_9MICO|nr:hypothetical protein [Cryobacterium levicorallinum]TFB82645.1 hypothetical protein E3O11_12165 [Cryobacterium levicorallinum]GEP26318.1 hypothetical protein CLE01_09160 [Cryobacterium levicorallinum]SFH45248.1 hypothetical protein SAMN05216274_105204 [Cryobacterium levicorallinum]
MPSMRKPLARVSLCLHSFRDAVEALYLSERSSEADVQAMRASFGTWNGRDVDGATWVDRVRSGDRLGQTAS